MENFGYLKKYIRKTPIPFNYEHIQGTNNFWPIMPEEIEKAEKDLNLNFPNQLKNFYQEIGYGFLTHPKAYKLGYDFSHTNRINSPSMIASILLEGEKSGLIVQYNESLFEPGDLPFFEVSDSDYFLLMKPLSKNPNAVYDMSGELIEDSFERFIWRLYHESPDYFLKR